MTEKKIFTPEELSVIDSKLRFIVFDWATHLIGHIMGQAKQKGVTKLYWNTPDTLESGATQDEKVDYFYERLPPRLGFKESSANLRGKGEERLWLLNLASVQASYFSDLFKVAAKTFTINEIPKKYQGAFLSLIGKKPFYTEEDIKKVIDTVGKKQQKKQPSARFFYDWSREWSGAQRFRDDVSEMVVLQKITSDIQSMVLQEPALKKFWAYLLSQSGHFGPDVLGFALVSPVNTDIWLINEIQTDCLNSYLKIRNEVQGYKGEVSESKGISWETIVDMLRANNRNNWVPKLENNETMKQQLMQNPNMIHSLPDDAVDIDKWIEEQRAQGAGHAGLDLMRHFQSVDMNGRVIRVY